MRYGVVIHGPEVIDSGAARSLLDTLERNGVVTATLGGAMGLAALLDAGMEDRVTIVPRQLVSDALVVMDRGSDVVVLLNGSKTRASGIAFGQMVVSRTAGQLTKPLVQLDDGFYIVWRTGSLGALAGIIEEKDLEEVHPPALRDEGEDRRTLHGIVPGENIWINGTVVGKATSSDVTVRLEDGKLRFTNVEVKAHGLEKVRVPDLRTAIIRSGCVRRSGAGPRDVPVGLGDRLILVDHRAEDSIFRARGARAAITVGDDTTRVAASLLARVGVPVIGIVDGDEDGICADSAAAEGSVSIILRPGNDDQLGERVRDEIFKGREEARWSGPLEPLVEKIVAMAGDKLMGIRKS